MKPILTCKQGTNADLFPDILRLYVPDRLGGAEILDMTYGRGVFWKNVPPIYRVTKNDIDPDRGNTHYDFRSTPFMNSGYDAVVLDPPYMFIHRESPGGRIKASIDKGYGNNKRYDQGHGGPDAIHLMYYAGMSEARRLLKPGGILILKCMDQVFSGRQWWEHLTYMDYADAMGFGVEDLFVLMQNGTPTMRWREQKHARRNHSYFLVLRKPNASTRQGRSRDRKSDLLARPTPDTGPDNPSPPTRRTSGKTSPVRPTKAGRTSKIRPR